MKQSIMIIRKSDSCLPLDVSLKTSTFASRPVAGYEHPATDMKLIRTVSRPDQLATMAVIFDALWRAECKFYSLLHLVIPSSLQFSIVARMVLYQSLLALYTRTTSSHNENHIVIATPSMTWFEYIKLEFDKVLGNHDTLIPNKCVRNNRNEISINGTNIRGFGTTIQELPDMVRGRTYDAIYIFLDNRSLSDHDELLNTITKLLNGGVVNSSIIVISDSKTVIPSNFHVTPPVELDITNIVSCNMDDTIK